MGLKDQVKDKVKSEVNNKIKQLVIKYIIPYVVGPLLILLLLAGAFAVIEEMIKDVADTVVKAFSGEEEEAKKLGITGSENPFKKPFDNNSDSPRVVISDEMIEEIKKNLQKQSIDISETYLTDALLIKSLEAYYATQYPYIEGSYQENEVKGCIYLKRGQDGTDMTYKSYPNFKNMLGSEKTQQNVYDAKKYFSVDDEENIVIATWSKSSTVTETELEGEDTTKIGKEVNTYTISEYKIDQRSMTSQYAMSYKLPILLGNMYSNEGFGIAVAELGINSKIELTILDNTTNTTTVTVETYKLDWKAKSKLNYKKNVPAATYEWWNTTQTPALADHITLVDGRTDLLC